MSYYKHQKNMDTPCSVSINTLSNNINSEWISAHHRNMAAALLGVLTSSHVAVGVE
jgi:hypothetical protein